MSNCANDRQADRDFTYQTSNYPPEGDTTSEGGYGSANVFSPQSQRRADPNQAGLIDQSPDGGPLASELQDAKQGADTRTREQYAHEARRDFAPGAEGAQGLNPYGRNPNSAEEAGERLAASYADQRGRQFESGGAASEEGDPGAF
ncbi:hypothetical protein BN946_scf184641.g2 [Trametes cinnabarina]|uniref:Uncharacterized protein n=1 Tax=Pycnoporus cinnabarinus TaxID=5643 RepID=A0A060SK10_PYCCI|nr:hypothetical protein BN946_scf184641.g2 [Trametes cinnabarina]